MTDSAILAQQASAKAFQQASSVPSTKTSSQRYYLPFNGARFIMPSGKVLLFADGCLETDIKEEIEEIEKAISTGAAISRVPMMVIRSDAIPMREVGASSKVVAASGTGMVSAAKIAALAAESNSK